MGLDSLAPMVLVAQAVAMGQAQVQVQGGAWVLAR